MLNCYFLNIIYIYKILTQFIYILQLRIFIVVIFIYLYALNNCLHTINNFPIIIVLRSLFKTAGIPMI